VDDDATIHGPTVQDCNALSALLPDYLDGLTKRGRAAHTVESTRLDLLQLVAYLEGRPVTQVTPDALRGFFAWLAEDQGNGISSLRRKTSSVKQLFRHLLAEGITDGDPSAALHYPALDRADSSILQSGELDALAKAATHPVWRVLVLCLIDVGLKRDEAVALLPEDIELPPDAPPPGRLHVRHRRASRRVRHRTLALSDRLASALEEIAGSRQATDTDVPEQGDSTRTLLGLSARGIDFVVETVGRRAGVILERKVTPMMLRDGFACARMRAFIAAEARLQGDLKAYADTRREHDRILLRELGLSDRSAAAERYRRLSEGF
jgi:site-specific recombinase XerD